MVSDIFYDKNFDKLGKGKYNFTADNYFPIISHLNLLFFDVWDPDYQSDMIQTKELQLSVEKVEIDDNIFSNNLRKKEYVNVKLA